MTVDYTTGEIVEAEIVEDALSATEARELTDRIKQTLTVAHELIIAAFKGRAWIALGYANWDTYCAGEFAEARMVRLDREQRREIVTEMKQAAMSNMSIASGLGVAHSTIDLDVAEIRNHPDVVKFPDRIVGLDGKDRPSQPKGPRSPHINHVSRQTKADTISTLAGQGYTSQQMSSQVGISDHRVRDIAREFEIDIPADRAVGRTKRLDHTQMVESTVTDLENTAEFVGSFIDLNEVDMTDADEWVKALRDSARKFQNFATAIANKKAGRAATRPAHTTTEEQ